jgi:hypothetical protein
MATFLYDCPITKRRVQGWQADQVASAGDNAYVSVTCLACGRVHLVNPANGKTAGAEDTARTK